MGLRNKQRDRKNAREYYLKVTKAKRMIAREVRDITRQHFK